ncbi:lipoprotein, putative [Microscilla marina ATCC 23134]|uniref:Lipoprotein, putative n=2 Tax=Microscilla marina TaxID=1027 RepID=A1ZZY4_MICM2|nr:lipoprotein, putative [Microscilla marina ATCC 23134]
MKYNDLKVPNIFVKMKRKFLPYLFLLWGIAACKTTPSVNPDTSGLFIKMFGGATNDEAYSAVTATDGGYVFLGATTSFAAGTDNTQDIFLIKADQNGNELWTRNLGGHSGKSIQNTLDGGFIVLGDTLVADTTSLVLIKTDGEGQVQWSKNYGKANRNEVATNVQLTQEGGYLMMGNVLNNDGSSDIYVIKTDGQGNIIRERVYGFANLQNSTATILEDPTTKDILWCGTAFTATSATSDIRVVRANDIVNTQWDYFFGGTASETGKDMKQVSGGYVIVGTTASEGNGGSDVYLIKISEQGILQWSKTFGGAANDEGQAISLTDDGGYIITGSTESEGEGGKDVFLIKTDADGNQVWTETFGGTKDDVGRIVLQTADKGFLLLSTIVFENNNMLGLIKVNNAGKLVE